MARNRIRFTISSGNVETAQSCDCLKWIRHLAGKRLDTLAAMVKEAAGVHEFMLLDTCNRVELHAVAARHGALEALLTHLLGFGDLRPGGFRHLSNAEIAALFKAVGD